MLPIRLRTPGLAMGAILMAFASACVPDRRARHPIDRLVLDVEWARCPLGCVAECARAVALAPDVHRVGKPEVGMFGMMRWAFS